MPFLFLFFISFSYTFLMANDKPTEIKIAPGQIIVEYQLESKTMNLSVAETQQWVARSLLEKFDLYEHKNKRTATWRPLYPQLVSLMQRHQIGEQAALAVMMKGDRAGKRKHWGHDYGFSRKLLLTLDLDREATLHLVQLLKNADLGNGIRIKNVRLNHLLQLHQASEPTDPMFSDQFILGEEHGVNAVAAWETTLGSPEVVIAVLDSGIEATHEDLAESLWQNPGEIPGNQLDDDGNGFIDDVLGYDFVSHSYNCNDGDCDDRDNDPSDEIGHGTAVAGLIAASQNGKGISGVAPKSKIMNVRVAFASNNDSGYANESDVAEGILYAVANGADIINMSFGGYFHETLTESTRFAYEQGVVLIAAAGEYHPTLHQWPGAHPWVINVGGATYHRGNHVGFSKSFTRDFLAPGVNILSTSLNNQYQRYTGTSFSAAITSGVAALLLSQHPEYTPDQVYNALKQGVTEIQRPGWDIHSGHGFLNALNAIKFENPSNTAAIIRHPKLNGLITGTLQVTGETRGTNIQGYQLFFSADDGLTWQLACEGLGPAVNGLLCADLDTGLIPNGEAYLRLKVNDSNGGFSDVYTKVKSRAFLLKQPLNDDVFRAGNKVEIRGDVFAYESLELEYTTGTSDWTTAILEKTDAFSGVLATWDTAGLVPGMYQIRVKAIHASGLVHDYQLANVKLDPYLKEGWPIEIPYDLIDDPYGSIYPIGPTRPVIGDLDGDGDREIVMLKAGFPSKILVYDHLGQLLWERNFNGEVANGNMRFATLADVEGNGKQRIFVTEGNGRGYFKPVLHGIDEYGNDLLGYPVDVQKEFTHFVLAADLDGNERPELIVHSAAVAPIKIFNGATGALIRELPLPINVANAHHYPIVVGNFDEASGLEIVYASVDFNLPKYITRIWVMKQNGEILPGWPRDVDGFIADSPSIGDVDGDGKEDIALSANGRIRIFDRHGEILPGFDLILENIDWKVPLADGDGDGKMEIVGSNGRDIYLYDHNGNTMANWPIRNKRNVPRLRCDTNADGNVDIVMVSKASRFDETEIKIFDIWGRDITPFPMYMEATDENSPLAIDDLDNDQSMDLVAGNSNTDAYGDPVSQTRALIYAWDLGAPVLPNSMPWAAIDGDSSQTSRHPAPIDHSDVPEVTGLQVSGRNLTSGFIDGRLHRDGLMTFSIQFDRKVIGYNGSPLAERDFEIEVTGGEVPSIVNVVADQGNQVLLTLSHGPDVGQWLTVIVKGTDQAGRLLPNRGNLGNETELDRIDIASLPGDINGNGVANFADIIDFSRQQRIGYHPLKDINRDGKLDGLDYMAFQVIIWSGHSVSLAPRP